MYPPLHLKNLCFDNAGLRLIENISVKVESPGISIIMGPNGAGKSLILRLMHGLLEPTRGKVQWNGQTPDARIRALQAMVFQRPVLLRRSVLANIEFVLRQRRLPVNADICAQLLTRVGLDGLQERPARRLSGGEQQRLALARALATSPQVMLMDEPTASLDPSSTALIETIIRDLAKQGTKIFFVTHDIAQAHRLADDILFMHRGHLLEHSAADAFFENPKSKQASLYLAGEIVL